jgi:hypothetical protein
MLGCRIVVIARGSVMVAGPVGVSVRREPALSRHGSLFLFPISATQAGLALRAQLLAPATAVRQSGETCLIELGRLTVVSRHQELGSGRRERRVMPLCSPVVRCAVRRAHRSRNPTVSARTTSARRPGPRAASEGRDAPQQPQGWSMAYAVFGGEIADRESE